MDELVLRCNNLQCREKISDQATVTTCSHILCPECALHSGLSHESNSQSLRICPICSTQLNNVNDAVSTILRPEEDYKTVVLSGFNPTTIMDCASRAMASWNYQASNEVKYQSFLVQSLTERYQNLNKQTDSIVQEANQEILKLQDQMKDFRVSQGTQAEHINKLHSEGKMLAKDLEALKRENRLLKAKERVPQFQDAAEEYADSQILSGPTASRRFRDQSQSNLAEGSVTASLPHFPVNRQKDEQIHRHRRSGAATNATALNYQTAIGPGLLNQPTRLPLQSPSQQRTRLPVPHRATPLTNMASIRHPLRETSANSVIGVGSNRLTPKSSHVGGHQTPQLSHPRSSFPAGFR